MARGATERLAFKFTGGHLCLDFVNTLRHRLSDRPAELLATYADLVSWGRAAGVLEAGEVGSLMREASHRPREAQAVLERAVALREVIHRIFDATVGGQASRREDLAALNTALAEAMGDLRLVPEGARFGWGSMGDSPVLERPLWSVVRSAAGLLTSDELEDVRKCGAPDCAWLFVDRSKNRSRRWCDMRTCGNRAKARRHYRRRRAGRRGRAP
jgi:predicted RNA-binding Zn ribbon-like protein